MIYNLNQTIKKIRSTIVFVVCFMFCLIFCLSFTNIAQASDPLDTTYLSYNDYGSPVNFGSIYWTETLPAGTTITVKVRSSLVAAMTGATDWATCTAVTNGTDISTNNCITDGHRYLQYYVAFHSDDGDVSASLGSMDIGLENRVDTLISSPFNTTTTNNRINSLVWSEYLPGSSNSIFQLRSSANGSTWTSWMGPDGTESSYFTDPTGAEAMPSALADGTSDQYIQYKAYLISDGTNPAMLDNINLRYDAMVPVIASSSPNITDVTATSINITIDGSDFVSGPTVNLVKGATTKTATNVVVVSANQITCTFAIDSSMVGIWDLKVTNANTGNTTLANDLYIYNNTSFVSRRDMGMAGEFGLVSWNQLTPTGTTIALQARSSANSDMSGASAWDTCTALTNGQDVSDNNCITDGHQYLEYKVSFTSIDINQSASLSDISFAFGKSDELISTPYDTTDSANLLGSIAWTEDVPSGTDAKFQIRTSPDGVAWTDWCGPDNAVVDTCATTTFFTDPSGHEDIDDTQSNGVDDRWMQYRVYFSTNNASKATVSDVTMTYVVNAIPEARNVTASQDEFGKVNISYEVRDVDGSTGSNTPSQITPSFEFWNGTAWASCTTMATGDTTIKNVEEEDYSTYTATWTPTTDFANQFMNNTAKIRVVVNDGEAANNIFRAESNTFILDTTAPALGALPILIDARTIPATLTLNASDDSAFDMKISLSNTLAGADWQDYNSTANIILATDPDTVYVQFKDAYGNTTVIRNITSPNTPVAMMVQDTTNINDNPPYQYRLFLAWRVVDEPSAGFNRYEIYRSVDNVTFTLAQTINDRSVNYYSDDAPEFDQYTFYKVAVFDNNNNISYYSETVQGKANGTQDAGEGGGGTESTPPSISNVQVSAIYTTQATITWDTDELSNSTVGYSADEGQFVNETGIATMANNASSVGQHSITLTGLDPDNDYYFKVQSIDSTGNIASSTPSEIGYTFHTLSGAVISNIATPLVSNTGFRITWDTNIESNSYVVYSSHSDMSGFSELGNSADVTSHSLEVNGLTPGTVYYYYVKSGVALDNNAGEYYALTTTQDVTAPVITFNINTDLSIIDDNTAQVQWLTNEQATSTLRYGTSTDCTLSSTNENLNTNHRFLLEDLIPGATYYFKLISTDMNGNTRTNDNSGAYFSFEAVDSSDVTPPVISGVDASLVTDTAVYIVWDTDESADSYVEYGTSIEDYASYQEESFFTLSHGMKLTGLSNNTKYYYRVTSADGNTNRTVSSQYSFTTLEKQTGQTDMDALIQQAQQSAQSSGGGGMMIIDKTDKIPPTVTNANVENITATSVEIKWLTDEDSDSFVEYGKDSTYGDIHSNNFNNSKTHSVKLRWLDPQTTYNYRVASADSWNNTGFSTNLSFTTISKEAELIQDLERELTFEEVAALSAEEAKTKEETLSAVTKKAIDMMNQLVSSVSLGELEDNLKYQINSIDEFSKLIPSPLLTGEPKVIVTANTATIAWVTNKDSNSLVGVVSEKLYNANNVSPYLQTIGNSSEKIQNHVVTIYDLEPDTTYHYQVKSKAELGPIAESRDFTFHTAKETLDISNYSAEVLSTESAKFKWITNIEADSEIRFTPYRNNILSVDETQTLSNKAMSVIHEMQVDEFESGVTYKIELYSHDLSQKTRTHTIDIFSTSKDDMPPTIYQVQNNSALSPGSDVKVQTIISWYTNEPSTTRLYYQEGLGTDDTLSLSTKLDSNYTKKHVVVLTDFKPGGIYRFKAESIDSGGNVGLSRIYTILSPRQSESVFQVIMKNVESLFGWMKNVK